MMNSNQCLAFFFIFNDNYKPLVSVTAANMWTIMWKTITYQGRSCITQLVECVKVLWFYSQLSIVLIPVNCLKPYFLPYGIHCSWFPCVCSTHTHTHVNNIQYTIAYIIVNAHLFTWSKQYAFICYVVVIIIMWHLILSNPK